MHFFLFPLFLLSTYFLFVLCDILESAFIRLKSPFLSFLELLHDPSAFFLRLLLSIHGVDKLVGGDRVNYQSELLRGRLA